MSRRRREPRRYDSDTGRKIRVVCTDRGQHPDVSFGHVIVSALGDGWHVFLALDHSGDEYINLDSALQSEEPLQHTYPLRCRRCQRDTPLRADTIKTIAATYADAGKDTIDLSRRLP